MHLRFLVCLLGCRRLFVLIFLGFSPKTQFFYLEVCVWRRCIVVFHVSSRIGDFFLAGPVLDFDGINFY